MRLICAIWLAVLLTLTATGCQSAGVKAEPEAKATYRNPVFEPVLADPAVIRGKDGLFYAYGTQDDWADGKGSRLVPILQSSDLVHWKVAGNAFAEKPAWKDDGGIWAPDISYFNGKYYLYYAVSVWADPNPGIGVATSDTPAGPFQDHGELFTSDKIGVGNSIESSWPTSREA